MRKHISFITITWLVFWGAVLFTVGAWAYPMLMKEETAIGEIPPQKAQVSLPESLIAVEAYEYYAEGLKRHALFGVLLVEEEKKPRSLTAAEILSTIRLLGIISGKDSQAIIEDTKQQKTYYLSEGEDIRDLKIKKIRQGRVFLEYDGDTLELHL